MRISRVTASGTTYAASFTKPPTADVLAALDALADAVRRKMAEPAKASAPEAKS